jgi:ectoine hydroxylase-related dioxygenase (phytanoyl-CoA dioxygenase family)
MELSEVRNDDFRENGFMVVENLLPEDVIETLCQRADAIAADLDEYLRHNQAARDKIEAKHAQTTIRESHSHDVLKAASPAAALARRDSFQSLPEIRITPRHARRGDRIYPVRRRVVDPVARQAALANNDPFNKISQLTHLADNDDVFRKHAAHANIIAVLHELLSPNVKLWFDHIFCKAPLNDTPPYGGANRYHQDGFFQFSKRSVTCWIALEGVTLDNGPFHYIPLSAGYGEFAFDVLDTGITARELEQEVVVTLNRGDAVFHDRWTIHATAPNETSEKRRGWALHYADAESKWGDHANLPGRPSVNFVQTADDEHLRDGKVHGNRYYPLVSGCQFPGCI